MLAERLPAGNFPTPFWPENASLPGPAPRFRGRGRSQPVAPQLIARFGCGTVAPATAGLPARRGEKVREALASIHDVGEWIARGAGVWRPFFEHASGREEPRRRGEESRSNSLEVLRTPLGDPSERRKTSSGASDMARKLAGRCGFGPACPQGRRRDCFAPANETNYGGVERTRCEGRRCKHRATCSISGRWFLH